MIVPLRAAAIVLHKPAPSQPGIDSGPECANAQIKASYVRVHVYMLTVSLNQIGDWCMGRCWDFIAAWHAFLSALSYPGFEQPVLCYRQRHMQTAAAVRQNTNCMQAQLILPAVLVEAAGFKAQSMSTGHCTNAHNEHWGGPSPCNATRLQY
jgi:hypothetical protein